MFIFCAAINDILKELESRGLSFVAYADDLIIAIEREEDI
jgi:hypothetical protein